MSEPAPRQPSLPPIEPGTVLAGKYRVERVIGKGGMGVVVEACHLALEERVALKFLLPDFANDPEHSTRFKREARASFRIKSEHVTRVTDVGELETGAAYMVMEFLLGQDLGHTVRESGPLPLSDAVDYVIQACEAIAEAHALGIVHRDLKPSNLFLTARTDGSPLVKVLDFGISKLLHDRVENLTRTEAAMGSALYMSPEQMHETRSVDHRTDIYALGITLFELCAGRPPFYAETLPQLCAAVLTGSPTPLRELRPDLPEAFAAVLARAYARDREQRYTSVAELVLALAPFAPPRSRPTIERIARMAGVPLAAAAPAPGPQPASPAPPAFGASTTAIAPGLTAALPRTEPIVIRTPIPGVAAPLPAPARAAPFAEQIVPGHYTGPMSSRAAATFASGSTTAGGASHRSPAAAIAAMFATALAVGTAIGVLVLRQAAPTAAPAPTAEPAPTAAVSSPSTTVAVEPAPSVAAVPPSAVPELQPAPDPSASLAASSGSPPARPSVTHSPPAPRPAPSPRPPRGVDLNSPD